MVPFSSLSSPVSIGFPAYYERLLAITRSDMGILSASLPLLTPLFCSRHSVLKSPGKDTYNPQRHLFWCGATQRYRCWNGAMGEKAIAQQEIIS